MKFDINDPAIHSLAAAFADIAVENQEKRINILGSSGGVDPELDSGMVIKLTYELIADQAVDTAVIPLPNE